MIDLEKLTTLEELSTSEPWNADDGEYAGYISEGDDGATLFRPGVASGNADANARFVAAFRNAAPLLRELRAARRFIIAWHGAIPFMDRDVGNMDLMAETRALGELHNALSEYAAATKESA